MRRTNTPPLALTARPPLREWFLLVAVWLVLAVVLLLLARQNVAAPGLYYDEAMFAGFAKDCLTGDPRPHVPAPLVVNFLGRPVPILLQTYLGGVKSWMLIPSFAAFGANMAVLRITGLCWGLVGLLVFMLWTRKLCGLPTALIAAPILAFDPSFFFLSVLDWGPFTPTFLCRVGGFLFILRWAESKRWRDGLLAAVFFGLGVLNKIDFVVILLGCGAALLLTYRKSLLAVVRGSMRQITVCGLIFLLLASPMALCVLDVFNLARGTNSPQGDLTEKLKTTLAMYDGTYIDRLLDAGGRFDHMYDRPCGFSTPFGGLVILAAVILGTLVGVRAIREGTDTGGADRSLPLALPDLRQLGDFVASPSRADAPHHTRLPVSPFDNRVCRRLPVEDAVDKSGGKIRAAALGRSHGGRGSDRSWRRRWANTKGHSRNGRTRPLVRFAGEILRRREGGKRPGDRQPGLGLQRATCLSHRR